MCSFLKHESACKLSFQLLQMLVAALSLFIANPDNHQFEFVDLADWAWKHGRLLVNTG
jgi:hypothetical protein